MARDVKIAEPPFVSIQGEGMRTGVLSAWVRFFGCTLRCPGFRQADPTDRSTYVDPLNGVDPSTFKTVFDIPILPVGCDTLYGIDPRFSHCAETYSIPRLAEEVYSLLPQNRFKHPVTGQTYDLCITGGEPMLWQNSIIDLYNYMREQGNYPADIQIETNGTVPISDKFKDFIQSTLGTTNWHFSVSPKLFSVSGEPASKAWKPEAIVRYMVAAGGWFKYVVNGTEACWDELADRVKQIQSLTNGAYNWPVMVMGVGATYEQQSDSEFQGKIAAEAIKRGYHVSGRFHTILFGNGVGT